MLNKVIEECFVNLSNLFNEKELDEFKQCGFDGLFKYHFGLGMWIRNNLLIDNSELHLLFLENGMREKDDMSSFIIKLFFLYQIDAD